MYTLKIFKIASAIFILMSFVFQIAFGNDLEKGLEENAKLANEAFNRCRNYLNAWANYIDDESGLLRENLAKGKNVWTPENSAADNFPFMIITSIFTKPEIAGPLLWKSLVGEKTLTLSQFGLPDAYDINKKMKLGFIDKIGSFGSLAAAAACPACFPMLAAVGAALGLGVLRPYEGWVFIVFQIMVVVAMVGNIVSYFNHRKILPLLIGIVGPGLVFFALYISFHPVIMYSGLSGLAVASVMNLFANRHCKKCNLEVKADGA